MYKYKIVYWPKQTQYKAYIYTKRDRGGGGVLIDIYSPSQHSKSFKATIRLTVENVIGSVDFSMNIFTTTIFICISLGK